MSFSISQFKPSFSEHLIQLIAQFRQELSTFKGINRPLDLISASNELNSYLTSIYRVILAIDEKKDLIGYIVIKIIEEVVWAESLYVKKSIVEKELEVGCILKLKFLLKIRTRILSIIGFILITSL